MPFNYELDIDENAALLRIACEGELTCAEQGEHVLRQAIEFAESKNLYLILLDIRALELTMPVISMMAVMIKMRDEGWLKGKRIARLLTDENFSNLLIGDISESMDLPIQNFANEQQALTWLKENK